MRNRACGKLIYSLYGTRDAAQNWEKEYSDCLQSMGFIRGKSLPCTFFCKELDARIAVHGDDFTILATESVIKLIARNMEKRYKIKLRGILGPDRHDFKEIVILNRLLRRTNDGLEYEPDPRHVELMTSQLGLQDAKAVTTPGVKASNKDSNEDDPLDDTMKSKFRALVARTNYLSQDRGDIQFSVKELSRKMSSPTSGDWIALKRLGRYLLGRPRVVCH